MKDALIPWISLRMLLSKGSHFFTINGWISLGGLAIGVACLIVSMAVVSGFESTLRESVADVTGHVQVIVPTTADPDELISDVKKIEPSMVAASAFTLLDGLVAGNGRLSGIFIEGLHFESSQKVLNLGSRLIAGQFDLREGRVLIGKGLAKNFSLGTGDKVRIVVPIKNELDPSRFKRNLGTFEVAGILDLGKHEYDERMVVMDIQASQKLAGIGSRPTGVMFRFQDIQKAREISQRLTTHFGGAYRVRDWRDINENLFEAAAIEKVVIFFVIFVIVVAAAFNVASNLYINVVKRYSQIGVLKAIGMSPKKILMIFSLQGAALGVLGVALGTLLGGLLSFGFSWAQTEFSLIPGSIYRIDHIRLQFRFWDFAAISGATVAICVLASFFPAKRGSQLQPLEGLRYE